MKSKFIYLLCTIGSLYCIDASALANTNTASFQTLYNFGTNKVDGGKPIVGLFQAKDGTLYGATSTGLINGKLESAIGGTIFSITSSGVESTIYSFHNKVLGNFLSTPLIQVNNNIYGGSIFGGESGFGNVYKLSANDNKFTVNNVISFNYGVDGAGLIGNLVSDANGNIYGTTMQGGSLDAGTVFKITPDNQLTILHTFTGKYKDGISPQELVMGKDGLLYGITTFGGYGVNLCYNEQDPSITGCGTIFSINPVTGEYTLLHRFSGATVHSVRIPLAIVFGSDNNLYGVALGGATGAGAFYKYDLTSKKLTTLYSFNPTIDGLLPNNLIQSITDGNFYGTTPEGGSKKTGVGTVFQLPQTCMNGPQECKVTVLHSFTGNDGALPSGIFEANDGNLYGVTQFGGTLNFGTVFTIKK
ncbi:MAG: hypothetical protein ORN24_00570 [Burkholderiales bacterium]|nr:hypothetical protein [Burkholderiales bacterium]